MRKLNDTPEDRNFLFNLLLSGAHPKAIFAIGCFVSNSIDGLTTQDYVGEVTQIDFETGYCNWLNENGDKMPCVNIECITLL